MIDTLENAAAPATSPVDTEGFHLGFATVAGYPSTVAGFVDPSYPGPDIVSLMIAPEAGIFATDAGRITVSELTFADWLKFDDRARLLRQIERAALWKGFSLNSYEGLNVLVWLVERSVSHDQEETISRALPTALATYRALVQHVGEQAQSGPMSRH